MNRVELSDRPLKQSHQEMSCRRESTSCSAESSRLNTAYHEAGHAVVLLHYGLTPDSVSIRPAEDYFGIVKHPSPLMFNCSSLRERRSLAKDMIVGCYAGLEAERMVNPQAPDFHGDGDEQNVFDLCRSYGVVPRGCGFIGDEVHRTYLEGLRRRARRLVRRLRPTINALAQTLLEKETLSGVEAEGIFKSFTSTIVT